MKPQVLLAIQALSSLSAGTNLISQRLLTSSLSTSSSAPPADDNEELTVSKKDFDLLLSKVKSLGEQVASLKEAIDELNDVSILDSQVYEFKIQFKEAIKGMSSQMMLQAYSPAYFKDQPKTLRSAIAQVLIDKFEELNLSKNTPDVWQKLVLSNGVI